jgi:LysR family hydrogen peroxide-inducible transcriptional activator
MTNVTLKQLRYVDALARHGHFGRAAEASAVTQPALSMQIKELEASLGARLFERGARQVRLTGLGEEIAGRARDILRAVDELEEVARTRRDGPGGRLRLGVIPTIAPYLLPRMIRDLAARYPGVDLQVRETQTERLIAELMEGRLDTAVVALPVSEPTLEEVALFSEGFVLVRPETEAAAPVPAPEALPDMQLLLLEEGHCFRDQALAVCGLRAASPRAGLDGSSLSTLVQMVGAGIGVTLIPEMAVGVETRGAPVAIQRFEAGRPVRTVGMIWRRSSPLAPDLRELAEVVRQSAEAMYASSPSKGG